VRGSQELLSNVFRNVNLGLPFPGCPKADIRMNMSESMMERRIDLESADLSLVSVEALESVLLSESISVENEETL
jgi:hypothetical protein